STSSSSRSSSCPSFLRSSNSSSSGKRKGGRLSHPLPKRPLKLKDDEPLPRLNLDDEIGRRGDRERGRRGDREAEDRRVLSPRLPLSLSPLLPFFLPARTHHDRLTIARLPLATARLHQKTRPLQARANPTEPPGFRHPGRRP